MSDERSGEDATADADEGGNFLDGLLPWAKGAVIAAGVALVAIVAAAQRDVATQSEDRLRGPRWLWKAVASTPPGVLLYGAFGTKKPKPKFPDLPEPSVSLQER
ncbi:MAG: hypothetical protein AAGA99_08895 [Actinomycetota bacterium]